MSLTIPKEQKHGVDVPAMMAFYQYVKLTPMGSRSEWDLQPNGYCEEIKWELSGDNIINLAKSYIQYDMEITTEGVETDAFTDGSTTVSQASGSPLYPHIIKGMKEGFGIASFRICNQLGTDLVKLDDSYEPYRIFMDELVRKRPDIFYQTNYYDGIQLAWDDDVHDCVIRDKNEWEMPKTGKKLTVNGKAVTVDNYKNKLTVHVKMHLGKFYNTFAALKSDIFFGERMYICIRFQTIDNFGKLTAWNEDVAKDSSGTASAYKGNIKGTDVKLKLKNFYFYAYYNKDSQCNNNTKSYCLSKPIQFNDFRCHQVGVAARGNGIFNYSFTLNSSNGPFVRFIIYRPWIEYDRNHPDTTGRYAVIPENAQFRWMINDFVYQPDYSLMQYYDSYMTVQEYFKDSWYDIFRRKEDFNHKFFEILNFGSKDLDNIKNQSGRPLASDLKITFEMSAPGTDSDFVVYPIMHRFYIITGRMVTINGSGIVSVI